MKSNAQIQATCQSCGSKFTVEQEYLERLPQALCPSCYRKKAVNEPSPTPATRLPPSMTVTPPPMPFKSLTVQLWSTNIPSPTFFSKKLRRAFMEMFRDLEKL